MFKVNNKDTRTTTPGIVLVSLLLTLTNFALCSTVSIVNFEQANTNWDNSISELTSYKPIHFADMTIRLFNQLTFGNF